jgi:hypothetical protein
MNPRFWRWVAVTVVVVAIAHVIPMAASYAYRGSCLVTASSTENIYLVGIMAAYRGQSLGNPFLAGHEDATRYLPELVQHALAAISRWTGLGPLTVVAISRVAFPVSIALLIAVLGRSLGLSESAAAMTAMLAPLGDPRNLLHTFNPDWLYFPRYFRAVSPAAHVFLWLLALIAVERARRQTKWRPALLAGLALGVLFYTPLYYWSVALAGTVWLTLRAKPPYRLFLLAALGVAALCAIPYARQSAANAQDPFLHETLRRASLLTEGRGFETYANSRQVFFTGAVLLILAATLLRDRPVYAFVMPFMTAATLLTVQNAVTNRSVQSHHFVDCLIPLWALILSGWLDKPRRFLKAAAIPLLFSLVGVTATTGVLVSSIRMQARSPAIYPLDSMMPATIQWLRIHTPAASVVFCSRPGAAQLLLFTENKLYWEDQAGDYVLSDAEVALRQWDDQHWTTQAPWKPRYQADYFLGVAKDCSDAAGVLNINPQEDTCIIKIGR